jgi:hypothetical protein
MSTRAATLMDLLGLSEDELCIVLDADALTLMSGQIEYATELRILLDLLEDPTETRGPEVLRRWVRATGPDGRPIDMLLARDFTAFEDAIDGLARRGFVLRSDGPGRAQA